MIASSLHARTSNLRKRGQAKVAWTDNVRERLRLLRIKMEFLRGQGPPNTETNSPAMYAIESANAGGQRWVSGVFLDRAAAGAELVRVSAGGGDTHAIVRAEPEEFPVFIIEANGFHYVALPELLEILDALEVSNDADHVHFNLYALRACFSPIVPGRDEMGRMIHWHVGDSCLVEPGAAALRSELHRFAGDA